MTAPTWIAALNLSDNAVSTMSAFNTHPKGLIFNYSAIHRLEKSLVYDVDYLIIDEISMISKDLFTFIYKAINYINFWRGKNKRKIVLIVVGDFYQLPPVCRDEDSDYVIQDVEYAFESPYWSMCNFYIKLLNKTYRQNDIEFIRNLNNIKFKENLDSTLNYFKANTNYLKENFSATWLYSKRCDTQRKNDEIIKALPGEAKIFLARTNNKKYMRNFCIYEKLTLKMGAKVMTLIRGDKYVNGTIGVVEALDDNSVTVRFNDNSTNKFGVRRWEKKDKEGIVTDWFEQIPVIPAYALTIHKAQGLTLPAINLDPKCFAPGQLYVALTRVRSVKDIYMINELKESYIIKNHKVDYFYMMLELQRQRQAKLLSILS